MPKQKAAIPFYKEISIAESPFKNKCSPRGYHAAVPLKRLVDILISSIIILCILSWLLPIIAILIKLDSRGPVFFKQKRVGLNGKVFHCLKLRSMVVNQDADKMQAGVNDPRITSFGKFLRLSCIDELPQFLNVLFGHMSIVGPRPHMISDCDEFSKQIRNYHCRHLIKPGITGLAQMKGYRGKTNNFYDIFHRFQWDTIYMRKASFKLDLHILYKTFTISLAAIKGLLLKPGSKRTEPASVYPDQLHTPKTAFSIVIVTKNAQKNINHLLESVKGLSDDIVVCDAGSSDATIENAISFGAKLYHIPWEGDGRSKNAALQFARHEWILSLDANEKVDDLMYQSLLVWIPESKTSVYKLLWKNFFGAQWIRYSDWGKNWKTRLFNKTVVKWEDSITHVDIVSNQDLAYFKLNGHLERYSFTDELDYYSKMVNSAKLTALKYHLKDKKCTWMHFIFSPCIWFLKSYFFRFGFLDGANGWLIAKTAATYSYIKYNTLWNLNHNKLSLRELEKRCGIVKRMHEPGLGSGSNLIYSKVVANK